MLGSHKKKNPGTLTAPPDNGQSQSPIPRELPPLRTFVIYGRNYGERPLPNEVLAKDDVRGLTVEAHGVAIDEERMISFVVFFYLDGEARQQPAQAMKHVINADDWSEVEEINPLFPVAVKH